MKKFLKYALALIVVLFVGYHSVYFKKLNEVQATTAEEKVNTAAYSRRFWDEELPPSLGKAIAVTELITLLETNPQQAFANYGKALGIGDLKCFLVKGEGLVKQINENDIVIQMKEGNRTVKMETEYVYGNAVRDASGLINMNEFDNTSDFNEISAGINKIIREEVLPDFKKKLRNGDRISFIGATELNRKFLQLNAIEITPVQLKILK